VVTVLLLRDETFRDLIGICWICFALPLPMLSKDEVMSSELAMERRSDSG
jgi:hypothetical protein